MSAIFDVEGAGRPLRPVAPRRFKQVNQALLLLLGSVMYALVKSVVSQGRVTLIDVEFLLIGLLPLVLPSLGRHWLTGSQWTFPRVWVATLVAYLVLSGLGVFEEVRISTFVPHGLDTFATYVVMCSGLSALAGTAAVGIGGLFVRSAAAGRKPLALLQMFSVSAVTFAGLVFMLPD